MEAKQLRRFRLCCVGADSHTEHDKVKWRTRNAKLRPNERWAWHWCPTAVGRTTVPHSGDRRRLHAGMTGARRRHLPIGTRVARELDAIIARVPDPTPLSANLTQEEFHDHHLALAVTKRSDPEIVIWTQPSTGAEKGLSSLQVNSTLLTDTCWLNGILK